MLFGKSNKEKFVIAPKNKTEYSLHMANIILTGMSGAGKSTIGVLAAKALGRNFIDTDILIQQQEHRLLQNIIDTDGIDTFLKIEENVVCGVHAEDCVIATGGSVVYSDRAMKHLAESGTVVYLYIPFEELAKRLKSITTRGIVMRQGSTLKDVYSERLPLYEKYSGVKIDCSCMSVEQCVELVVKEAEKK